MRIAVLGGRGVAGQAAVEAARLRGHRATALSRSSGTDLLTGDGLAAALEGHDVVIDCSSLFTLSAQKAVRQHRLAAQNVVAAGIQADIGHAVVLSIVGVDRNPHNYYAGKLTQEEEYLASDLPVTVLRTTQFHEFAGQSLDRAAWGPLAMAIRAQVQPVAVAEVGLRLVELSEREPAGRARDLAGPHREELAQLSRAFAAHTGSPRWVVPVSLPLAQLRGMARGLNLPGPEAELRGSSFAEWLRQR